MRSSGCPRNSVLPALGLSIEVAGVPLHQAVPNVCDSQGVHPFSLKLRFLFIILFGVVLVCGSVYGCARECVTAPVWKSEDILRDSVFSFSQGLNPGPQA